MHLTVFISSWRFLTFINHQSSCDFWNTTASYSRQAFISAATVAEVWSRVCLHVQHITGILQKPSNNQGALLREVGHGHQWSVCDAVGAVHCGIFFTLLFCAKTPCRYAQMWQNIWPLRPAEKQHFMQAGFSEKPSRMIWSILFFPWELRSFSVWG